MKNQILNKETLKNPKILNLRWLLWLLSFGIFLSKPPIEAQPACVQPPSGMIACWSLDEPPGSTAAADRVGNHPGAYANGPLPGPGEVRGALCFNGSSYVSVQDS